MVYNNSYRISRKSRNWLSAIRGIRYLRYLSVMSSMIDNQALGQNIDIPTDTFSAIFKHSQKVRRNSFPTSFLPENQCSILIAQHGGSGGEVSATSAIPPHVVFIFYVRFLRLLRF